MIINWNWFRNTNALYRMNGKIQSINVSMRKTKMIRRMS